LDNINLPDPLEQPLAATQRDALLIDMHGRLARIEGADLDSRVRSLEKRQWGLPASMLVALFSLFGIHPH
jgi:hypothetical protein